ncbi:hypothetical protein [Serratia sp. 14-2641]|uniref:hypothetical protein n=1 Tax=Serratia sp. 14-2641 TaxID=1841657 RepID=UPI00080FC42C|nr:hypothetical protein [Serratia sp. 14-2641]OCJ30619.1 hypothetical protein A6U95_06890 [Serratia sp. 14-2641]
MSNHKELIDKAKETLKQLRLLQESEVAEHIFTSTVELENGEMFPFSREISDVAFAACGTVGALLAALEEAKQRLQQPIKLPQRYRCEGYHIDEAYLEADNDGDCFDRDEVIAALTEQGFKVEGE